MSAAVDGSCVFAFVILSAAKYLHLIRVEVVNGDSRPHQVPVTRLPPTSMGTRSGSWKRIAIRTRSRKFMSVFP